MIKACVSAICGLFLVAAAPGPCSGAIGTTEALARERKHFMECLAFVYSPEMWFSYNDSLYFTTMTEFQLQALERIKNERSAYTLLTNSHMWHGIASQGIAASGVGQQWMQKLLLPDSGTNGSLIPTLGRTIKILSKFDVIQRLDGGDALIQAPGGAVYFVMNFGRGADDAAGTNGLILREGVKTYTTQSGSRNTVEAYSSVGLNAAERGVLQRVSAEFRKEALRQVPAVVPGQAREEFELLLSRATDSNPYMQYLVAKAYLEGTGTTVNRGLGLEWMRRAEANGSGDAKTYLEQQQRK